MKLFTSIILGGVLQVLAVSASRAAYINPDRIYIYKAEIYGISVSMFCLDR